MEKSTKLEQMRKLALRAAYDARGQTEKIDRAKQNKLTGTAGQVVGFGADGTAVAVQGWSNPNLVDVWYFPDPPNQRGQAEYTGKGYTIDRWVFSSAGGELTLADSGIEVRRTTETRVILQYIFTTDRETFVKDFGGRTMTISALFGQNLRYATLTVPTDDTSDWYPGGTAQEKVDDMYIRLSTWGSTQKFSFSFDLYVSTGGNGGGLVTAVKCEYGSQQTLAHQDASGNWVLNDPPPNKALELAKCQRFQIAVGGPEKHYEPIGIGVAHNSDFALIVVPLPTSLRSKPTIVYSGDFFLYGPNLEGSNSTHAVTNMIVDEVSNTSLILKVTVSEALIAGSAYILQADSKYDNKLLFDASL